MEPQLERRRKNMGKVFVLILLVAFILYGCGSSRFAKPDTELGQKQE